MKKIVIIATGKKKRSVSILRDEFCVEQPFLYLFLKLGYDAFQDIPLSHARYMKGWWTLIGTLHLIKIFLSVYEEQHLPSSINFVLHKIKLGTLASEHFRYLTEVTMYFHLWAQAKEQQRTGNSFVWCNSYD